MNDIKANIIDTVVTTHGQLTAEEILSRCFGERCTILLISDLDPETGNVTFHADVCLGLDFRIVRSVPL